MDQQNQAPESDWDKIKNWIVSKAPTPEQFGSDLTGLHNAIRKQQGLPVSSDTAKVQNFADGGLVGQEPQPSDFIPQDQPMAPAPIAPAMPSPVASPVESTVNQVLGDPAKLAAARQAAIRPGVGGLVGMGVAGLGDAIARSYGHDQGAHALQTTKDVLDTRGQNILKEQEMAQSQGKERFALGQQLEAKDPASGLSKQAQATYGALLLKQGFSPDVVAKMPASLIADLTGKSVDAIKAETEGKVAAATMGLRKTEADIAGKREAQTEKNQSDIQKLAIEKESREAENQRRQRTHEAAETTLKETSKFNPLNWLPGSDRNKAYNALSKEVDTDMAPDFQTMYDKLPVGARYLAPDGNTKRKK